MSSVDVKKVVCYNTGIENHADNGSSWATKIFWNDPVLHYSSCYSTTIQNYTAVRKGGRAGPGHIAEAGSVRGSQSLMDTHVWVTCTTQSEAKKKTVKLHHSSHGQSGAPDRNLY